MINTTGWSTSSLKSGALAYCLTYLPASLIMRPFFSHLHHASLLKGNDEEQCHKGLRFLEKNDLKRAVKEFDNVLIINPENIFAWQCKAYALLRLDTPQEALHALIKAAELNPSDERVWQSVGQLLFQLGLYRDSLTAFDRVTAKNPCNTDAWFFKAMVHSRQHNVQFALDSLYKALEYASPLFREIYRITSTLDENMRPLVPDHHQKKVFGTPLFCMKSNISGLASALEAWFAHSTLPLADDRIVQFLSACENALDNQPSDARLWMYKGMALIELQKTYEALYAFDYAINLDPSIADEWYWFKRAQIFALLENRKKALSYLDEAIKLNPFLRECARHTPAFNDMLNSTVFKSTVA
ncbi:MAG: tetratricopeptide repeat protein [Candidatus Auribacterota bacterium]